MRITKTLRSIVAPVLVAIASGCATTSQIPSEYQKAEAKASAWAKQAELPARKVANLAVDYAQDGVFSRGEQAVIWNRAGRIYGDSRLPFGHDEWSSFDRTSLDNLYHLCTGIKNQNGLDVKDALQRIATDGQERNIPENLEVEGAK